MKHSRLYIALLSLFLGGATSQAQVARAHKAPVKAAKPGTVVPTTEDLNFAKLFPATAKVMFIDSLVTNESDFLKHLPLSPSCGKISIKKSERADGYDYYYTNAFENKRFSSVQQASGRSEERRFS